MSARVGDGVLGSLDEDSAVYAVCVLPFDSDTEPMESTRGDEVPDEE